MSCLANQGVGQGGLPVIHVPWHAETLVPGVAFTSINPKKSAEVYLQGCQISSCRQVDPKLNYKYKV